MKRTAKRNLQVPSSKFQRSSRLQCSTNRTCQDWRLEIEISLELGTWNLELSFLLLQPFLKVRDNHAAGLLRRHVGIVDDLRAERNHQRRGGALAVPLVTGGKIFVHAVSGAAARALIQVRVQVILDRKSVV